jgi:hypothetical protein
MLFLVNRQAFGWQGAETKSAPRAGHYLIVDLLLANQYIAAGQT